MAAVEAPPRPVRRPSRWIWPTIAIVVVLIGAAATIARLARSGSTARQFRAACNSDARSVLIAVAAYNSDTVGAWPPDIAALTRPDHNLQPYLRAVPVSSHYTITLAPEGAVLVNGADYEDGVNAGHDPCAKIR